MFSLGRIEKQRALEIELKKRLSHLKEYEERLNKIARERDEYKEKAEAIESHYERKSHELNVLLDTKKELVTENYYLKKTVENLKGHVESFQETTKKLIGENDFLKNSLEILRAMVKEDGTLDMSRKQALVSIHIPERYPHEADYNKLDEYLGSGYTVAGFVDEGHVVLNLPGFEGTFSPPS